MRKDFEEEERKASSVTREKEEQGYGKFLLRARRTKKNVISRLCTLPGLTI